MTHPVTFQIPRLRAIAVHALPRVLEGTIIPLLLFLGALRVVGVWGALGVGLTWTYGAIAYRLVTRRSVPGILAVGALTATGKTALALATKSVFVYFLQPTLGTFLLGGAFLASTMIGRPLTRKLAHDFCPLPDAFTDHPHVRRFFHQISLLWGAVFLANAAVSLWLLVSQSVGVYVVAKQALSTTLTVSAIGLSVWWFKREMTRHGILARVERRSAPVPALVPVEAGAAPTLGAGLVPPAAR